VLIQKGIRMKKYNYSIQININKFYALEYDPKKKSSDPILLPLMYDNENQGAFLYRNFDKQDEAKAFFEMLSYFCTASEIEVSVEKDVIDKQNTIIGNKQIAKFTLKDENYPEEKIKELYKNINWDVDVELYNYIKEVNRMSE